jgi:hypothetical protein
VRAFSHTHVQGAGDADLGTIGVMPFRGDAAFLGARVAVRPAVLPSPPLAFDRSPFASPFSHADESAAPGAYEVALPQLGVRARLLASGTHAGAHEYACASGTPPGGGAPVAGPCGLAVDVCHRAHSGPCGAASAVALRRAPAPPPSAPLAMEVEGVHQDRGEFVRFNYTGVSVFFYAIVSASDPATGEPLAPLASGVWSGYAARASAQAGSNASAAVGSDLDSLGAYLVFPAPARVEVRVGLSTVSAAGARANLAAEQGGGGGGGALLPLEAIAAASDAAWEAALGAVRVALPSDVAEGASDRGALAAAMGGGGGAPAPGSEAAALADGALGGFLGGPRGVALALSHGWPTEAAPPALLAALRAFRSGEPGATAALAAAPLPRVDVPASAQQLRRAVAEASAAAAAPAAAPDADLTVFYTLLYLALCVRFRRKMGAAGAKSRAAPAAFPFTRRPAHTLPPPPQAPSTYSDANGQYLGFDFAVHDADGPGTAFLSCVAHAPPPLPCAARFAFYCAAPTESPLPSPLSHAGT